jgi:hypothetical protein
MPNLHTRAKRKRILQRLARSRAWRKPPLRAEQILAWADAHYQRTGRWPTGKSGRVDGTLCERWSAVDAALSQGCRGLERGGSLAKLLVEARGVRRKGYLPRLGVNQILSWADAYFRRTGQWPTRTSGPVNEAPGETWLAIDKALSNGSRGIRTRSSLAELLARRRGRRHKGAPPALTVAQILAWAEAHHLLVGTWPTTHTGAVGTTGETSHAIDQALRSGMRGLRGGSSIFRLLKKHRKVVGKKTPFRRPLNRTKEGRSPADGRVESQSVSRPSRSVTP